METEQPSPIVDVAEWMPLCVAEAGAASDSSIQPSQLMHMENS
jgi:hypothetical protein